MASYLTSDTLIESVVRRAHLPESQNTFTDEDLLAFANEEMQIGMIPAVLKLHEEFFVYTKNVDLVANTSNYAIPERAIGDKARSVFYQDTSTTLQEMSRINPDDIVFYQNSNTSVDARVFYLQNSDIVLVPSIGTPAAGSALVFSYFMRPNQLVTSDRIATITAIDTTTGDITVDAVPTVVMTSTPIDFMQTKSAHKTLGIDVTPVSVNSITKILNFTTTDLPTGLAVGDIIALAGETYIPQIPDELHSVLAQRVACRCLEAQKDTEGLQSANAKLQEMEVNLGIIIDNRVEGSPQKVNNLRGPLRAGRYRR